MIAYLQSGGFSQDLSTRYIKEIILSEVLRETRASSGVSQKARFLRLPIFVCQNLSHIGESHGCKQRFQMRSLVVRFRFRDSLVLSASFEDQLLIAQLFFASFYIQHRLILCNCAQKVCRIKRMNSE